ncbi:MAG TPA: hypothetical protein VEU07_06830 [Candidatus Acidoferrum sp.]|nr:hypothetical protein [Candidatus Acidoferrum sp.]
MSWVLDSDGEIAYYKDLSKGPELDLGIAIMKECRRNLEKW